MYLDKYRKVVLTTKTFDGVPRVPTKIMYEADLVITYHKGEFITHKDRRSRSNKKIEIDETTAAKFLLQNEKTVFLKWEERKFLDSKKEEKKFEERLNEIL